MHSASPDSCSASLQWRAVQAVPVPSRTSGFVEDVGSQPRKSAVCGQCLKHVHTMVEVVVPQTGAVHANQIQRLHHLSALQGTHETGRAVRKPTLRHRLPAAGHRDKPGSSIPGCRDSIQGGSTHGNSPRLALVCGCTAPIIPSGHWCTHTTREALYTLFSRSCRLQHLKVVGLGVLTVRILKVHSFFARSGGHRYITSQLLLNLQGQFASPGPMLEPRCYPCQGGHD